MKTTPYIFFLALMAIASPTLATESSPQASLAAPRPDAAKPALSAASQTVQQFYAALTKAMQQGPTLGFAGRYDLLRPAIENSFNLPSMTRFAVGPSWYKMDAAQQQELIQSFGAFSVSSWAHRFKKFSGEQFVVAGEKQQPDGSMIVETRLLPKDGKPVTLNYLMRKNAQGAWQIHDVYLDAAISELASRRAEFSSILRTKGTTGLIETLHQKITTLRKTSA